MKQGILITAHKNLSHLIKIVDWFDNDFLFFIHIDKKTLPKINEIELLKKKNNVALICQKYRVNWGGGVNHLKSTIFLIQEALKYKDVEYFHLISGSDFPIKDYQYFRDFFLKNRGKEFIAYSELPKKNWSGNGGLDRLLYFRFYDIFNAKNKFNNLILELTYILQKKIHLIRQIDKKFPKLYGGSDWWTLSRECLKYVMQFLKTNPHFLRRFRFSFCATEIFFQTIILNSNFKEKIINNNLRFIEWENRNGNCPANLDESDYNKILNCEKLFARKFEYPVSLSLLNTLILNKSHLS